MAYSVAGGPSYGPTGGAALAPIAPAAYPVISYCDSVGAPPPFSQVWPSSSALPPPQADAFAAASAAAPAALYAVAAPAAVVPLLSIPASCFGVPQPQLGRGAAASLFPPSLSPPYGMTGLPSDLAPCAFSGPYAPAMVAPMAPPPLAGWSLAPAYGWAAACLPPEAPAAAAAAAGDSDAGAAAKVSGANG